MIHPKYAENRKLGWCLGVDSLINLDELNCVMIHDFGITDSAEFMLGVFFQGSNTDALLDSYDTRFEAERARSWLHHLLRYEILKEDWEKGRHDESFRETITLQ